MSQEVLQAIRDASDFLTYKGGTFTLAGGEKIHVNTNDYKSLDGIEREFSNNLEATATVNDSGDFNVKFEQKFF